MYKSDKNKILSKVNFGLLEKMWMVQIYIHDSYKRLLGIIIKK